MKNSNLMKVTKFSKLVENTGGKGEIACYEQFLLFPQSFKNTCTADTYKQGKNPLPHNPDCKLSL